VNGDAAEAAAGRHRPDEDAGVAEVVEQFEAHLDHLRRSGDLAVRRRRRLERRLHDLLRDRLWGAFRSRVPEARWAESVDALMERRLTPRQAASRLAKMSPESSGANGTRRHGQSAHRRRQPGVPSAGKERP